MSNISPEALAESKARLGVPDDWEWFFCCNEECEQVVWVPPGFGDLPKVEVTCSNECALKFMQDQTKRNP